SPSNGGTSSTGAVMMPLRMENIEIAYNRVENTDWDGIQLSNARGNAKIHDNTVRNFGRINLSSQQAGIILGGNTQGDIYNNTVSKGTGNGIEVFGYGLNKLYGNTIDSTGWDGSTLGQESVFLNDLKTSPEANPKQQIYFYNNAIRNPKTKGAVRVSNYQSNSLAASVYDNTYCIPNAPANWQNIYVLINAPGSTVTNQTLSCGVAPTSPTVPPVANVAPTANAGADQVITLPTSGVTLNGSGTDTDGTISSYSWTKVSGPAATINTASAASTTITGLVQGVYEFKLTVTDNAGATGSDNVIITVNSPANATPTANAGSTQTITLPTSSVTLNGSGTDSDGSIVSYQWTKTTGGNATITNAAAASTTVTGLAQGVYTFQLKVTDNAGATATANVAVTVNSAPVATGKVIRVNLFGGNNPYNDTKWNNWNTSGGLNSAKFLYEDRSLSNVSASLEAQALVADNGANYASGATVAPQGVFRYVSANTSIRNLSIKGLTPGKKYSFEFYASRATTGNATEYRIGSKKDTIKTDNNIADYAKFTNITADGAGNVTVLLTKIGVWNYISGFSIFEEGSPAAAFAPDPFESIEPAKSNEVTFGETLYEESTSSVSAYPNPFVGSFNVSINSRSAGLYSLVLLTTNGQRVYYKEVSKPIGTLTESINVRSLPAGTYVLQIISKATGNKTVHRVVKGE
ncbi:MAG: T9SS type A sorting domain-containing protein, partial [Sphingobacteriales bacterium]